MPALEKVRVSPEMRRLIERRTEWIIKDFVNFDRPIRTAFANAYLAGVNDCLEVLESDPERAMQLLSN